MILGLEGVHIWRQGDDAEFALNVKPELPMAKVRSIDGLHAAADFSPETDEAIGRIGESPRTSDRSGRSVTYEGTLMASTLPELIGYRSDFIRAFSSPDEERMDVEPHPDYSGPDLPTRFFNARALEASADEIQGSPFRTTRGWERPFTLTLRLSDPRVYDPTAIDTTDDTAAATGGAPVPFTPGGSSGGASSQGFTIVTNNPGTAGDTPMTAYLFGALRNPVLVNDTTGKFLRFRGLDIPDGEYVKIEFRRRRVVRDSGANVRNTLDPASDWWDRNVACLIPGNNQIRLRAYGVGGGAKLQLIYNPADDA